MHFINNIRKILRGDKHIVHTPEEHEKRMQEIKEHNKGEEEKIEFLNNVIETGNKVNNPSWESKITHQIKPNKNSQEPEKENEPMEHKEKKLTKEQKLVSIVNNIISNIKTRNSPNLCTGISNWVKEQGYEHLGQDLEHLLRKIVQEESNYTRIEHSILNKIMHIGFADQNIGILLKNEIQYLIASIRATRYRLSRNLVRSK